MKRRAIVLMLLALLAPAAPAQKKETAQERAMIALDQVADVKFERGSGDLAGVVVGLTIERGKLTKETLAHLKAFPQLRSLTIHDYEFDPPGWPRSAD